MPHLAPIFWIVKRAWRFWFHNVQMDLQQTLNMLKLMRELRFFSTPLHQDLRLPLASIATCLLQKSPDPPSYRCRRTPSSLQGARCKSGHRSLAALAGVARSDEGQSPVGLRLCEGTTNRSHPNRLQWHLAAIPASLPASESYPKPVSRAHGKALRRNIQLRSRPHQLHSKKCCGNPRRALWPLKQARLD